MSGTSELLFGSPPNSDRWGELTTTPRKRGGQIEIDNRFQVEFHFCREKSLAAAIRPGATSHHFADDDVIARR